MPVILFIFMVINLSTSSTYVASYKIQKEIKSKIQQYISTNNIDKDTMSIIVSVEPSSVHGEAPVFMADWDLVWYLRLMLDSKTLKAYPIYVNPKIDDVGFNSLSSNTSLPYKDLYYYDYNLDKITPVNNKNELKTLANKYFQANQ